MRGVVLDPDLAARPRRSARRSARISGVQPAGRPGAGLRLRPLERQEVVVAPDVLRPGLDAAPDRADVRDRLVLVLDLQRAEAPGAHVACLEGVLRRALSALELLRRHMKPPPLRSCGEARGHATSDRNWHRSRSRGMVAGASKGLSLHPSGCVQLSTGTISAMPNLPKPRFGRPTRGRGQAAGPDEAAAETPNVEVIEAAGLRWLHIEQPRPADRAWLEEHFDFHPLDYEDVLLAQPAPEGRRVRRVPLRRPALPALRQVDRAAERRRARHVRRAGLRHHAAQRAAAAARVPLRALQDARGAAREAVLQGPRLPALQDRRRLRRRLVPDAAQDGQQARAPRGGHLRGPLRRDRARHLERQAGDHQLPQDRPPAAHGAARPRAHEALHPRGPGHLLRRHQRRVRAHLGHARELQGGRRGARVDERVRALAPGQRRA